MPHCVSLLHGTWRVVVFVVTMVVVTMVVVTMMMVVVVVVVVVASMITGGRDDVCTGCDVPPWCAAGAAAHAL
jgi:hypothetical protein